MISTRLGFASLALLAACSLPEDADEPGDGDADADEPLAVLSSAVSIPASTVEIHSEQPEKTVLASVQLHAGPTQPRSLYGRFVVKLPTEAPAGKLMAAGEVACTSVSTGRQHSYLATTQNIWVSGSQITMVARMLFQPTNEDDYDCELRGWVGKYDGTHYLRYLGGSGKTELVYSSPTWVKQWGMGSDSKHAAYSEIIDGERHDYVAATHVHGGITERATDGTLIGNQEYVAKSGNSFPIPEGPSSFNAIAGIHMTSCFKGPGTRVDTSCFPGARTQGAPAVSSSSVVDLAIVVTQLDDQGGVCVQHIGPTTRFTILGDSHHRTANIVHNDVPIDDDCGSRRFTVKTLVTRISGNPVRIERGDVNANDASRITGYSHGGVYY